MQELQKVEVGDSDFMERVFQMTYGFKSTALYYHPQTVAEIRDALKNLRFSFRTDYAQNDCRYDVEDCRKAYMFAHYPYHVDPAYHIVKEFVAPNLKNRKNITAHYFACGPGPEIYATIKALTENGGGYGL